MSEVINKLSEVTGLKRADMEEIWKSVKANQKVLNECSGPHYFQPIDRHTMQPIPEPVFGCKFKCSKCGGWVDQLARSWYCKGIAHAKLTP